MKQTNNAIKFLMAQYRAIFKNAYLKGLTSAVVLTAGLAAAQANAAGFWTYNGSDWSEVTNTINGSGITHVVGTQKPVDTSSNKLTTVSGSNLLLGTNGITTITAASANALFAGGYVNHDTASVLASGNTLTITKGINEFHSSFDGGELHGGYAKADANIANATGNTLEITKDTTAALFTKKVNLTGGTAIGKSGAIATGNKVDITGLTLKSGSSIIAGDAQVTITNAAGNATSQDNSLTLTNITFGTADDTAPSNIVLNKANITSGSEVNIATANGSQDNGFIITGGKYHAVSLFGGYANHEKGGSATANNNTVSITDAVITKGKNAAAKSSIQGGYIIVSSIEDNKSIKVEASNNTVTISNTNTDPTHSLNLDTSIIGAATISLNGSAKAASATLSGTTAIANNNKLIIGENVKVNNNNNGGRISAAYIDAKGNDSQTITSTDKISIKANNNTVEIFGEVEKGQINAVEIKGGQGLFTQNNVIINGKTIDVSQITGGAGADSAVTFNDGSLLKSSTQSTTIISDVVKLAGNVEITNNKTVVVKGFYSNGKFDATAFNPNATTVESTANIQNAGTLTFKGETTIAEGAKLHATADKALISVNSAAINNDLSGGNWDVQAQHNVLYGNGGFVGDIATLKIHQSTLNSYLTAGDEYTPIGTETASKDAAGTVQITRKGILEFQDKDVVLSDYAFVAGSTAEAGKIQIDDALGNGKGSIFRADNITLAHQLVKENGSTNDAYKPENDADRAKLLAQSNGVNSAGVILQAKNLTLGSAGLTQAQSQNITFGYATVSESVNFIDSVINPGSTNAGKPAAFELVANINLDAKTKVIADKNNPLLPSTNSRDELGNFVYYTPNDGKINGNVLLTKSSKGTGTLHAENGNWTATGNVAMKSGSQIIVGKDTTSGKHDVNGLNTDATLTLANGLTLYSDDANDKQKIIVNGGSNNEYDFDDAARYKDIGNFYQHLALLDLRKGITLVPDSSDSKIKGLATINATYGGVVLLNGSNLSDVLAKNADTNTDGLNDKGVLFSANNKGKFVVEGTLSADFNDFVTTDSNTGIYLKPAGILEADKIVLAHKKEDTNITDDTYVKTAENTINLEGIVRTKDLEINDTTVTTKKSGAESIGTYASSVRVATGKISLSNSLSSVNNTLIFGNSSNKRASLTLETDKVQDKGAINVKNIKVEGAGNLIKVTNGQWGAKNTAFTLASGTRLAVGNGYGSSEDSLDAETYASLTAKSLTAEAGALVKVGSDGTLTLTTADFSRQAKATKTGDLYQIDKYNSGIVVAGDMTILGDASLVDKDGKDVTNNGMAFGKEGSIVVLNSGHLKFGEAATTGAIIADNVVETAKDVSLEKGYGKISLQGGEVELGLKNSVFSAEAILDLKKKLFTADSFINGTTPILSNGGILNIGEATFKGLKVTDDGDGTYTAKWEDIKNWSDITNNAVADVTNNQLGKTDVTNVSVTDEVRGHYGSITMDTSSAASNAKVQIVGDASLRYSAGNNGFFISNADDTAAAGAIISSGKILKLIDGGKIGDVVLNNGIGDNTLDDYTILQFEGKGENTVASITGQSTSAGIAGDTLVNVLSKTTVTGDIKNIDEVSVDSTLVVSGNMVANDLSVNGKQASVIADTKDTKTTLNSMNIEGGQAVFHNLELNGVGTNDYGYNDDHYIYDGGLVKVNNELVLKNSNNDFVLHVGADKSVFSQEDKDADLTGTGLLEANVVELNKGTIFVDPEYNQKTSLVAINQFKTKGATTSTRNLGQIDGQLAIGKNAAMGLGSNLEALEQAISHYQNAGSLDAKKYGSILYINGQVELMDGATIALDSNELNKSILDVRKSVLTYKDDSGKILGIDMGLGANTALIISDQAFTNDKGVKTETAFHFNKKGATVYSNGGEIVLQGSFNTAEKLNIFTDNDAAAGQSGSGIKLVGKDINIFTENGFMFGTIKVGDDVGYNVGLTVDTNKAYNIMHEASDPVVQTLIAYGNRGSAPVAPDNKPDNKPDSNKPNNGGSIDVVPGTENNQMQEIVPSTPIKNEGNTVKPDTIVPSTNVQTINGSSAFLDEVITTTNGAPAETVARLGVYGGAAQAAIKAGASSYEAILGHMGIGGQSANLYTASNGQGGNLWVSPIYVNSDSDSFGAQGLSYGVDMNLYGLALGGEFNLNNNIRFGAMFNVGSGDADGKGAYAATNVSNDFNYYGFGAYVGFTQDKFSVVADVTYTLVDNDIKGKTSIVDVGADLDSTNISVGVTGQYELDLSGISVIPHVGLRYTNIDLDGYSIKGNNEEIATYSADKMSIFSVPVGVTFAKEFVGESWTVKPSVDFTLTGNFGDDTSDGSVMWTGTDLKTNTATEVIDSFTYGVSAGLSAQTGSFVMGVGINYSGSSNVSDFGINANARFTF